MAANNDDHTIGAPPGAHRTLRNRHNAAKGAEPTDASAVERHPGVVLPPALRQAFIESAMRDPVFQARLVGYSEGAGLSGDLNLAMTGELLLASKA